MFLHCKDPLPLSEACLHGLLPSLNAPVVDVEELPSGPVRAALVIYAEDYGDLGLALGMRALESGDTAVYKYREPILDESEVPAALEAVMGFAEGLGFLFDDDMIDTAAGTGRRGALEHWNRLMGDAEVFAPRAPAEPPAPDSSPGLPSGDQALLPPAEDLLLPADELDLGTEADEFGSSGAGVAAGGGASPGESTGELLLDDLMDEVVDGPEAELWLEADDTLSGSPATAPASEPPSATATAGRPSRALSLSKFRAEEAGGEPAKPAKPARRTGKAPAARAAKAAAKPASKPASKPAAKAAAKRAEEAAEAAGRQSEEGPDDGGRALGRIAIVRKRGGEDGRPSLLSRLLASF